MKLIKQARGFTLIEVLIVMVIVSIVTSVALLSIKRNDSKQIEIFATELKQQITLAQEKALLQPMVLGILIDHNQVQFYQYHKNNWIPLQDTLISQRLQNKLELNLRANGEKVRLAALAENTGDEQLQPQIIISTNGDITPFRLYIGKPGEKPRYVLVGHADGNVSTESIS